MFDYNKETRRTLLFAVTAATLIFGLNVFIVRPLRGFEITVVDYIARIVILIGMILLSINWIKFIKGKRKKNLK